VTVTVADDGPGFSEDLMEIVALPERFASGGRGLYLMKELTDEVTVKSSADGTMVTLVRSLDSPRGG
jgi:anti-sigma regulatory factor (Ser/Thr protein kinase)